MKISIQAGDMAPWWEQGSQKFIFDNVAGRYIVLVFCGSADEPNCVAALELMDAKRHLIDEGKFSFFAVCNNSRDTARELVEQCHPATRFLWDAGGVIHRAYGADRSQLWIILNPMLRVAKVIPFEPDGSDRPLLSEVLEELPPPSQFLGLEVPPPILLLSDVFEADFCRELVDLFDRHGGRESGFMQEVGGKSVEVYDHNWKSRRDYMITDVNLIQDVRQKIARRVVPEIWKAFHFSATRIERDLVCCYAAEEHAHFGPHRDDTIKATAHRRFAISINLNANFVGGELRFPEYSSRTFKPPIGTAVVFSGSILHSVSKITKGRRYAYLPFMFDEEGEKIRLANWRDNS